jgi:CRISPR-associated protein Cas2
MAIQRPRLYLVCYDIADPRRLQRVHRYLRRFGLPLQYSVFTVRLSQKRQQRLLLGLKQLIDEREDDVRMYPLPDNGERLCLGRQMLPEDVVLVEGGGPMYEPVARKARSCSGHFWARSITSTHCKTRNHRPR